MEFDIPEMIIDILTDNNYTYFSQKLEENDNGDIELEIYGITYPVDKTIWGYSTKFISEFWWFLSELKKKIEKKFEHPVKITLINVNTKEFTFDLKFTISMNKKIK